MNRQGQSLNFHKRQKSNFEIEKLKLNQKLKMSKFYQTLHE